MSASSDTEALLRERLAVLSPTHLELFDDSARHAGHAGAKDGGHFNLVIVSEAFSGKNEVSRHRMIYKALGDLMRGKIHALGIRAFSPEENR